MGSAILSVAADDVRWLGRSADEVIPRLAEMWGREALLDALGKTTTRTGHGLRAYSQRDPEWASDALGFSTGRWTIGNGGCAVTSLAILASRVDPEMTPGRLNRLLQEVRGFSGAELDWAAVERALPYMRLKARRDWNAPVPADGIAELRRQIELYGPVIVEVDFHPATSAQEMHFVVGLEVLENDMRIIDPWDGAETWLMRRYAREGQTLARVIWGTRVYQVEA